MKKIRLVNGKECHYNEIKVTYNGVELETQSIEYEENNPEIQVLNLSSNEPHIWNDCPVCGEHWMCKVENKGNCPGCSLEYKMKKEKDGDVIVCYVINID